MEVFHHPFKDRHFGFPHARTPSKNRPKTQCGDWEVLGHFHLWGSLERLGQKTGFQMNPIT